MGAWNWRIKCRKEGKIGTREKIQERHLKLRDISTLQQKS